MMFSYLFAWLTFSIIVICYYLIIRHIRETAKDIEKYTAKSVQKKQSKRDR